MRLWSVATTFSIDWSGQKALIKRFPAAFWLTVNPSLSSWVTRVSSVVPAVLFSTVDCPSSRLFCRQLLDVLAKSKWKMPTKFIARWGQPSGCLMMEGRWGGVKGGAGSVRPPGRPPPASWLWESLSGGSESRLPLQPQPCSCGLSGGRSTRVSLLLSLRLHCTPFPWHFSSLETCIRLKPQVRLVAAKRFRPRWRLGERRNPAGTASSAEQRKIIQRSFSYRLILCNAALKIWRLKSDQVIYDFKQTAVPTIRFLKGRLKISGLHLVGLTADEDFWHHPARPLWPVSNVIGVKARVGGI